VTVSAAQGLSDLGLIALVVQPAASQRQSQSPQLHASAIRMPCQPQAQLWSNTLLHCVYRAARKRLSEPAKAPDALSRKRNRRRTSSSPRQKRGVHISSSHPFQPQPYDTGIPKSIKCAQGRTASACVFAGNNAAI
jgi:hypothetical protein